MVILPNLSKTDVVILGNLMPDLKMPVEKEEIRGEMFDKNKPNWKAQLESAK